MSTTPAPEEKAPARSVDEILADIDKERQGLNESFEKLRGDLDEAMDDGAKRAEAIRKKATVIGPIVGGAILLLFAALFIRRLMRRG